ncbi:MAG: SMI1/KNR4 family protein [Flavobacterium sp.]|nr:MAG: SMI1/KNR4 family protein [Flavobacterium sp.]
MKNFGCLEDSKNFGKNNLSDFEIRRFEKHIGYSLPDDYKNFLKHWRGGYLDDSVIFKLNYDPTNQEQFYRGESAGIEAIFGLNSDSDYSLYEYFKRYCLDQNRMMPGMIPIGNDAGSNNTCILLTKEKFGQIFFWDHNWEIDFDDPEEAHEAFRNCYWIADSFSEFANSLSLLED